jgi:hypothetical protein
MSSSRFLSSRRLWGKFGTESTVAVPAGEVKIVEVAESHMPVR